MHRVRKSGRVEIAVLLGFLLWASGCVYVPPLGEQFSEQVQAQISLGESNRTQIEALLGKPGRLDGERIAVYSLQKSAGTLMFLLFGGYTGEIVPVPLGDQQFRVLLGYDEQGVLRRREIETSGGKDLIGLSPERGQGVTPIGEGSLLLAAEGKDLLGMRVGIAVNSVHISSEYQRLVAGGPKLVGGLLSSKRVWIKNLATDQLEVLTVDSYDDLEISSDFTRVALLKKDITIIDLAKGRAAVLKGGGRDVSSLEFYPDDSQIVTGNRNGLISIWGISSGEKMREFRAHDGPVWSIAFSPDGRYVATSEWDGAIGLWRLSDGAEIVRLEGSGGTLAFSGDGRLLGINRRTHVEIWELRGVEEDNVRPIRLKLKDVFLLPFAANGIAGKLALGFVAGSEVLVASNGSVIAFDYSAGKEIFRLPEAATAGEKESGWYPALSLSISADSSWLAIGTAGGVYGWRLQGLID